MQGGARDEREIHDTVDGVGWLAYARDRLPRRPSLRPFACFLISTECIRV